ncbi:MAG: serine/threonine protein kinase [Polyangiaceae bacterium]|nr:serine/threonine protein kinase [Polyangiaceae bacterium]
MAQALPAAQGAIQFHYLAEIAVGTTARVDLCRASAPLHLAGKLLAVKRLHQHIAEDPNFANQFLDEVWMTASLKHPNVVEVAGWGQDEEGMYLAVELVQGVSLQRLMKTIFDTGEAFTERMVVYIAAQLCRGLAAAHGLRAQNGELLHLVHRDLTPGNVIVSFDGAVKIADFGLAKAKQRLTKTLTGLLKGHPAYMSPEQARGESIDLRTDLFSLGVLMFELFTGRKPWNTVSDFDAVQAILTRPPDDLRDIRPKVDRELAAVVQRCLEKPPAARFQSALEIQTRLDEWLLVHGYQEGNDEALARFVRRNAMRQMRWFERAVKGDLIEGRPEPVKLTTNTGENRRVDIGRAFDEEEESTTDATDVTDVEQMVAEMRERANDPRLARRMVEEADYGEEVPTIVQKSVGLPLKPKGAPAQPPGAPKPGPAPRADAKGPPPRPMAQRAPAAPSPRPPAAAPKPPSVPAPSPAVPSPAQRAQHAAVRPPPAPHAAPHPAPMSHAGSHSAPVPPAQRPTRPEGTQGSLGPARPPHDSILDEDSDARTTAVKTKPRPKAAAPLILPPIRDSQDSISDAESEEIPTLPISGVPQALRASRPNMPGHVAAADPRAPQPPHRAVDEPRSRPPISEERLFAEADRFALEAVRFGDEAKAASARAERAAMIAKISGDAAAIAVEAVRIASTSGIGEAVRRLEDAYELERTIARLGAMPLDLPPSIAAVSSSAPHAQTSPLPVRPQPPPSSPGMAPPRDLDQRPSFIPPPSMAAPSSGSALPIGVGGTMRMGSSMIPPPSSPQTSGALEAFGNQLRPTIFGLPSLHVAALAIGTFVGVLILMWIILG